ncbi:MAG: ABC transporter permease [Sphaerochaeta sp.]|jgi:ABC-type lipoprotein release transport system permease subunit|nr:ABC transporter permease [Sphaerochaeta sp.]
MLNTLTLAWRNIFRYRVRTIITLVAIAVSVCISILVDGLLRGVNEQSLFNLTTYETGEVTLYADGYFADRASYPTEHLLEESQRKTLDQILDSHGIAFAPRYKTVADLSFYDEGHDLDASRSAVLVGVDPQRDGAVFRLPRSVSSGRWLETGDDGVVVGEGLADKLNLSVGSLLTIQGKGREGFLETFDAPVVGILTTENPVVNSSELFMTLDALDGMFALDGGVTEYAVSDGKVSLAGPRFLKRIRSLITPVSGIQAYDWREVESDLVAVMNGDKGSSLMILVFLFLLAAAGITNTMLMAVMERRKECAMLRAMGFSRGAVTSLFVWEGVMTGLLGALSGALAGALATYPLAKYGIDLSGMLPADIDLGYRITLVMRSGYYPQSFIGIPLCAVALSALSCLVPVARATKEDVASLLRRS